MTIKKEKQMNIKDTKKDVPILKSKEQGIPNNKGGKTKKPKKPC